MSKMRILQRGLGITVLASTLGPIAFFFLAGSLPIPEAHAVGDVVVAGLTGNLLWSAAFLKSEPKLVRVTLIIDALILGFVLVRHL